MAQTKFKLNTEEDQGITHAHTHVKETKKKPTFKEEPHRGSIAKSIFSISSGANLSVHLIKLFEILTPTQKQQLMDYADKDDRTASCVIKEALVEQGIIQAD